MAKFKFLLIGLLSFFFTPYAQAQEGNWELGLMAGGAGYMGDLNLNNPLKISGISASAYGKYNFNQYVGTRLNYTFGKIQADDANSVNQQFRDRNLRFKTTLSEFSALVDFNFFNYNLGGGTRQLTPYVYTGVGFLIFKPTVKVNGEKSRLDYLATEGQPNGYKNVVLSIPYGVGIRYNYKDTWSVFSELGYRTPMTDYLDDVSGNYPAREKNVTRDGYNFTDPSIDKIGVPGTQRGDYRKRDTYLFVSVGISFTFVSTKCYSF